MMSDCQAITPTQRQEVGYALYNLGYGQGSADAWFGSAIALGLLSALSYLRKDGGTPMFLGATIGCLWNAYDSARNV